MRRRSSGSGQTATPLALGEPKVQVCLFKVSEKVSVRSLAVLFCLSVSSATSPPRLTPPLPPARTRPLLPACLRSWHGRVRALQAARSFSCILLGCHKTRWAPFNPISEIHSDVGKRERKKRERNHIFISPPCPSSANFTGSKRVAPINDRGPEAAPALAQEQHVSSVGWHHARPASLPTLKQMK